MRAPPGELVEPYHGTLSCQAISPLAPLISRCASCHGVNPTTPLVRKYGGEGHVVIPAGGDPSELGATVYDSPRHRNLRHSFPRARRVGRRLAGRRAAPVTAR